MAAYNSSRQSPDGSEFGWFKTLALRVVNILLESSILGLSGVPDHALLLLRHLEGKSSQRQAHLDVAVALTSNLSCQDSLLGPVYSF